MKESVKGLKIPKISCIWVFGLETVVVEAIFNVTHSNIVICILAFVRTLPSEY